MEAARRGPKRSSLRPVPRLPLPPPGQGPGDARGGGPGRAPPAQFWVVLPSIKHQPAPLCSRASPGAGSSAPTASPDGPGQDRAAPFWGDSKRGEGFYFGPAVGRGKTRPRRSEPVLKVKSLRVPAARPLLGNNALPLPSPGLGFWGREGETQPDLPLLKYLGAVPPAGTGSGWKSREDPG